MSPPFALTNRNIDPRVSPVRGPAGDAIEFIGAGASFDTDVNDGNPATLLGSPTDVQAGDSLFCFTFGYSTPATPTENPGPWVEQGTVSTRFKLWKRTATADANDNFTVPLNAGDTTSLLFNMRASNGNPLTIHNQATEINQTEIPWSVNGIAIGTADDTMLIYAGARNVPNNNGASTITPTALGSLDGFTVIQSAIRQRTGAIQRERLGWCAYKFQASPSALAATTLVVGPTAFNGDTRGQTMRYVS